MIINSISESEFMAIAKEIQDQITDTIIKDAVRALPKEVYQMSGDKMIHTLISRRERLLKAADS